MTGMKLARIGTGFAIVLTIAACDQQALNEKPEGPVTIASGATVETKEVQRPDVFSAAETGLWDGRPSLGGIWIAHPDATDPERVKITVTETGRTVAGALFRRERNNPGPRIQVSSDAATALGMLAGQPAQLEVVALRTETVEIAPPPAPEPASEPAPEADLPDASVAAATAATAGAAAAAAAPRRASFWDRLRGKGNTASAAAGADEAAAGGAGEAATAEIAPEVETQSLDAVAAASAAIERAEQAEAASPDAPQPADAQAAGGSAPYVQVGLFASEADADAASAALRRAGIPPLLSPLTKDRDTLWRVLVGPAETAEAQKALLSEVKGLGYSDAYLTAN